MSRTTIAGLIVGVILFLSAIVLATEPVNMRQSKLVYR